MNQSNKQAGFSAVIVLVAVLVLAGAGFAAWRISQAPKADHAGQDTGETESNSKPKDKVVAFSCKGIFTVSHPDSLQTTVTDAEQCLVSNVGVEEMPPVGPLPPEQFGLFFNAQTTNLTASDDFLDDYIERSQEDYPLELKSKEEIKLNSGSTATLATVYGGHPTPHDFYFFVLIKDGTAVTASYPVDSNHKEIALSILKSIR